MDITSSDSGHASSKHQVSCCSISSKRKRNPPLEETDTEKCGEFLNNNNEEDEECKISAMSSSASKRIGRPSKSNECSITSIYSDWSEVKRAELIAVKFVVNRVLGLISLNDQENIFMQKLSLSSEASSSASSSATCSSSLVPSCCPSAANLNKKSLVKYFCSLVESLRNWRSNYEVHIYQERRWDLENVPKHASSPPTRFPFEFKPFPAFRKSEGIRSLLIALVYLERGDLIHRIAGYFRSSFREKDVFSVPIQILIVCMLIATKVCEDISFTNAWWAKKGKIELKILNHYEHMILASLGYKVNVPSTDALLTSIYEKCYGGVYF